MRNKLPERSSAFCGIAGMVMAFLAAGMARHHALPVFTALVPVFFSVAAIAFVVFFRLRLMRLSEEEQRDEAYLRKDQAESSLFQTPEEAPPFSTTRTRRQIERHAIPWVAPVLGLALAAWTWRLFTSHPPDLVQPTGLNVSAALLGVMAFVSFLTSRFLLGLSRHDASTLLRGPGILAGLACWLSLAGLAGVMAFQFGWQPGMTVASRLVLGITGVVGIELMLNSLLSLYLHRRDTLHATYESRLGALMVDPGILTRSMTEAIDYQFGFSFSQTWFFKVLQRAIIPLVSFQLLLLYGMSSVVFLDVHETGIIERFGKPEPGQPLLSAGFHLKKPWPLETVRRVPTGRVLRTDVGFFAHDNDIASPVLTWTVPHYAEEDTFLVATRNGTDAPGVRDISAVAVSMVTINLGIEYRITNAFAYTYGFAQPEELLRQLGYQAATRQLARHDLADVLGENRSAVSGEIHRGLQQASDRLRLGVRIEYASLHSVHPPVQVADAFQSVIGALEEKEAVILEARAYTNQVLPLARAYVESTRHEAEAGRHRQAELARADAARFEARRTAHATAPGVFRNHHYLDMLEQAAAASRLYLLDLPGKGAQTLWLNLEEKQFSGVLDMAPLMMEEGHE